MVSKFGLLTSLLLASAALAAPPSRLEARLARRRESRQSQPLQRVRVDGPADASSDIEYSPNWAGAVWSEAAGTFTSITGTFTVPTPSGSSGSAAAAWVGIDGATCQSAILQTGIDFTVGSDGGVSYDAWYEWYPDYAYDFSGISVSAGDVIKATVTAYSTTSGVATIENLTNRQTVTQNLNYPSYPLCEQDAEWIVEDFEQGGNQVPFADFGTVTFTSATATTASSQTYKPGDSGSTIDDIEQNGQVLTSVSTSGSSVTITYE